MTKNFGQFKCITSVHKRVLVTTFNDVRPVKGVHGPVAGPWYDNSVSTVEHQTDKRRLTKMYKSRYRK